MIVLGRHRPLTQDAWNELAVRAVIEEERFRNLTCHATVISTSAGHRLS